MKLLKEWNDFESLNKKAREFLRDWYRSALKFKNGTEYGTIDSVFGLPYTSSGEYAAIWNTNSEWVCKQIPDYAFRGVAISESGFVVAVLESQTDDVNNETLLIPIGRAFNGKKEVLA